MTTAEREAQLQKLAEQARAAEGWAAGALWREYELVKDAGRDPDELIAEGVALSAMAIELAGQA